MQLRFDVISLVVGGIMACYGVYLAATKNPKYIVGQQWTLTPRECVWLGSLLLLPPLVWCASFVGIREHYRWREFYWWETPWKTIDKVEYLNWGIIFIIGVLVIYLARTRREPDRRLLSKDQAEALRCRR